MKTVARSLWNTVPVTETDANMANVLTGIWTDICMILAVMSIMRLGIKENYYNSNPWCNLLIFTS